MSEMDDKPENATSRRRILDAAEELIAENGFDATPTARIAKVAGVPKGLVFHYFPTKADVLTALVDERTDVQALRELSSAELDIEPGDVASALSRIGHLFRQGAHASARMRRLIFREAETHPEVQACVRKLHGEVVRIVRGGIDKALQGWTRAEEIAAKRREAAAETFAALLIQEASLGSLTGQTFDLDAIAKLLAAGLQAPPAPTPAT